MERGAAEGRKRSEHRFPLLLWKQCKQKVSFHTRGQFGGSPSSVYLQHSRSRADSRASFAGTALSECSAGSGGAGAALGLRRVSPKAAVAAGRAGGTGGCCSCFPLGQRPLAASLQAGPGWGMPRAVASGILAIAGMRGAAPLPRSRARGVPGQALGALGCLLLWQSTGSLCSAFCWLAAGLERCRSSGSRAFRGGSGYAGFSLSRQSLCGGI